MVDQGVTVLWERFDTWIPGMGFNPDPMNGINHMGFGSVAEWIFQTVSGIFPDPANPGYGQFLIEPRISGPVNEAETAYHSVRGKISSRWKIQNGKGILELIIPPNTSALVRLPVTDPEMVTESGRVVSASPGVRLSERENGWVVYEVQSGKYEFNFLIESGLGN
jgi:alpha-L-rhamnosidase